MNTLKLSLLSLSTFGLLACQSTPQAPLSAEMAQRFNQFSNAFQPSAPALDSRLGEVAAPNESRSTREIEQSILTALKNDHLAGPMTRDVHAKHHGCVKAQVKVNNQNLAPELRVGIFAQNQSFPSWIRFSNGASHAAQSDAKGDIRGMAIKLMGVQGPKLMQDHTAPTQDLVMMNNREFFIENINDYVQFSEAIAHGKWGLAKFAVTHPRVSYRLYQIFAQKMANPIESQFFSATAYRLGPKAIKFKVQPCQTPRTPMPTNPGPNYLREALSTSLSQGNGCMDLMVQVNPGNFSQMPIENATVEWPESLAPYLPVARIEIPQQSFESEAQMNFCENLSFTPWHALPEHRPLGVTNRVRRSVYELISSFRHDFNGVQRREPTDFKIF